MRAQWSSDGWLGCCDSNEGSCAERGGSDSAVAMALWAVQTVQHGHLQVAVCFLPPAHIYNQTAREPSTHSLKLSGSRSRQQHQHEAVINDIVAVSSSCQPDTQALTALMRCYGSSVYPWHAAAALAEPAAAVRSTMAAFIDAVNSECCRQHLT